MPNRRMRYKKDLTPAAVRCNDALIEPKATTKQQILGAWTPRENDLVGEGHPSHCPRCVGVKGRMKLKIPRRHWLQRLPARHRLRNSLPRHKLKIPRHWLQRFPARHRLRNSLHAPHAAAPPAAAPHACSTHT